MKYRFIEQHRNHYPVRMLCRVLRVSRSGYYGWQGRTESPRAQANRALLEQIRRVHQASRSTYGSPRVHAELRAQGEACGRHRVARLMRSAGLRTRMQHLWSRSRRGKTFEHIEEDKLQRMFNADGPNQRWVADYTYLPTREGWLYVAGVMDLYSRLIVGWSMSARRDKALALDALQMAVSRRSPKRGLLVHTDQGMEYRTADYHRYVELNGFTASMSRRGNCLDNAAMESFFHTLKTEHSHHYQYKSRQEARQSVFEYIEVFYNQQRRHSTLNYMTPMEFEAVNATMSP